MEKFTSEVLAGMTHEELESVVLSLQIEVDDLNLSRKMYQDWRNDEMNKREIAEKRLSAIKVILGTWG